MVSIRRKYVSGSVCFYFLLMCLSLLRVNGQVTLEGLTFKDALSACVQAIGDGDLSAAAELFGALEQTFGAEEEYQAPDAQQRILPLKGMAELGAGLHINAAETLEAMLAKFPDSILANPSLLYGLAQAQRSSGNLERARQVLTLYIARFPNRTEAGLAFLERADLLIQDGLLEEALAELDAFLESSAAVGLRMQAQLKAVQACLDNGLLDQAVERMLRTQWTIETMPELAQLAFSALRCGEHAMAHKQFEKALKLFPLVPPKQQLIKLQEEKLNTLADRILSGRRRALWSSNRHQQSYLNKLQQELNGQLQALKDSEDYTPTLYLHYGQCLLLQDYLYQAWLMFEYIALQDAYPQPVREEAHYRWVVTAHQLEDWEEALTIARNFVERYPSSKLAPQALYLIAKAHLEQGRIPESIDVLNDLIDHFPDHALAGRWLFTRGFNFLLLESYDQARQDFSNYEGQFPEGTLLINARLWKALTHYFEKDYSVCIRQLKALKEIPSRHPLYPEILYRLAATHYAARQYQEASTLIADFLTRFGRHARIEEARVLQGDIAMGEGKLEEALSSFAQVSREAADLFLYSLFQTGKIYRAQENYEAMIAHFTDFLEDPEAPRIRLSEALYWLGWAYQQRGRIDEALPVFEEALEHYGNDPLAAETGSILRALEALKRRQSQASLDHRSPLVRAENFKAWLRWEINRAMGNQSHTYLSRLVLYYNQRFPEESAQVFPLVELAKFIPTEAFDPEALGYLGLGLLTGEPQQAEFFLTYLIETYTRSNARAMGYLGLAKLAFDQQNYLAARDWLTTSEAQIPVHPHRNESQLLLGQTLSQLKDYSRGIEIFEELLRLKSARGRPHATALLEIARAYSSQDHFDKATAYYQRVYNLYRAYPDLVVEAYWESAQLFESMDRIPEAVKTLEEMLGQEHLADFTPLTEARNRLEKLYAILPEEPAEPTPGEEEPENE